MEKLLAQILCGKVNPKELCASFGPNDVDFVNTLTGEVIAVFTGLPATKLLKALAELIESDPSLADTPPPTGALAV